MAKFTRTTTLLDKLCLWSSFDWRNGVIIPLPKKGDMADCNNWRGITLLSVPGKVFCGSWQSAATKTSWLQTWQIMQWPNIHTAANNRKSYSMAETNDNALHRFFKSIWLHSSPITLVYLEEIWLISRSYYHNSEFVRQRAECSEMEWKSRGVVQSHHRSEAGMYLVTCSIWQTQLEELNLIIKREDWDGWGMYYAWKITEYQSKRCTGKQTITPSENQEDQGRTGSILYAKTWRALAWPGKILNNLRSTEKIGVEVWPNVSTTRDDLSLSKSCQCENNGNSTHLYTKTKKKSNCCQ